MAKPSYPCEETIQNEDENGEEIRANLFLEKIFIKNVLKRPGK